jgi:hypothetical protein
MPYASTCGGAAEAAEGRATNNNAANAQAMPAQVLLSTPVLLRAFDNYSDFCREYGFKQELFGRLYLP